ncbi:AraC family transcriptional regulator [Dyadobacter sp. CY261]|uniref:helix-turn-helix domain-containing protein n=1 Tax=Dyadobacter sp. CY261 TaxID=2907203 RepID=UPI001F2E8FC1|nr:AraC family transcriptional regulator [Dyadobacter sp. CY261]MCF0074247.1 AraC family transcriptional regulator [Dyadobacter sp. CY261]
MQLLPTATYLGNNLTTCQTDGIWTSVTTYSQENLPNVSLHAHENPHITMLLAGATLEKRQRSECYRQAGEAVFFHAGEPHQNSKTVPGSQNFNIEFTPGFLEAYDLTENHIGHAICVNPLAAIAFLRAYRQLLHKDHNTGDSITMAVLGLFGTRENAGGRPPGWVGKITELLHDRWNEQVSLRELSVETGTHPVTISKYFPRYFGCTLSEYMRKLRVMNSIALIKNTPYRLTRIAHESGFADQAHFTRAFKQVTGFLPKEYRAT